MDTKSSENMGCCRFKGLIQKRLDGDITPVENEALNDHLADCDRCRDELVSFLSVGDLVNETMAEPVEVPEGFFENLAEQLEEVEPARGLAALFGLPIFTTYRNYPLATASFILVGILSLSVIQGLASRTDQVQAGQPSFAASSAVIQTNAGDRYMLPGDEGDSDRNAAALDDLEKAYREAQGENNSPGSEGYIHTSWGGKEVASPIH